MKYVGKPPGTDKKLRTQLLSSRWQKIREPRNLAIASLLSLPLAFLLGGMILWFACCHVLIRNRNHYFGKKQNEYRTGISETILFS